MILKLSLRKIVRAFVPYGILWLRKKYLVKTKSKSQTLIDFFVNNPEKAENFMRYIYGSIIKEGDCVIDVGANHGIHTIPLSKIVGESGLVLACEAIKANIDDIKLKVNLQNTQYYCAAITKPDIAKREKEISFNYYPRKDGYSGIKRRPDAKTQEIIVTVPTITLDKIVLEQKELMKRQISFVKIDVEKGDFDVLLGAENILKKYKPVVVFENVRQPAAELYKR